MTLLEKLLVKHGSRVTMGGPARARSTNTLQADLRVATRATDRYLWIAVVMLAVLFVVTIGTTLFSVWQGHGAAILGSFGISCSAMIYLMIRLWRQRMALEILLVLVRETDDATANTLVAILREHLVPQKR